MIYFWGKKIKIIKCNYVIILWIVINVFCDLKMVFCFYVFIMEWLFKYINILEFYLVCRFYFFFYLIVVYIDLIYK